MELRKQYEEETRTIISPKYVMYDTYSNAVSTLEDYVEWLENKIKTLDKE